MTRTAPTTLFYGMLIFMIVTPMAVAAGELSIAARPGLAAQQSDAKPRAIAGQDAEQEDDQEAKPAEEEKAESAEAKTDGDKPAAEEKAEASPESKAEEKTGAKAEEKTEDKAEAKAEEKPAAKPPAKKRKTHKVEPKRLKVEVSVDGVFVARKMEEVVLRPETWSSYEIEEVVEHGSQVRRGQVLVKFDNRRINEAIADLELEQRLNELAILRAEEELPRQERTLSLNLENAERNNQETKDDFERYNEIDRPMIIKQYAYMVKRSQFNLNYEQEELGQLEKMYAADDLTEETEEIILTRQRNLVDFAEFSLESSRTNRDEVMDILLPRLDIQIKQSLERAEMALARAKMAAALDVNQGRYELEKRKVSRARSLEKHAKLIADRGLMELKAPADGIVYYGRCVDGKWSDMASMINRLRPHNNVSSGTVVMTVLEPRPVFMMGTVTEAKRPEVEAGQKVKIVPPAEGSQRIDGKVEKIAAVPTGGNRFAIEFEFAQDDVPDWVVAGMTGKASVNTYDKPDALAVPKAATHTDEDDEDVKYVWIVDPDDEEAKPERRDVTLGKTSGSDVEVVKGLKKGDVVSLEDESEKEKEE